MNNHLISGNDYCPMTTGQDYFFLLLNKFFNVIEYLTITGFSLPATKPKPNSGWRVNSTLRGCGGSSPQSLRGSSYVVVLLIWLQQDIFLDILQNYHSIGVLANDLTTDRCNKKVSRQFSIQRLTKWPYFQIVWYNCRLQWFYFEKSNLL